MEVVIMTGALSILWILAIGALVYFMIWKGGDDCDSCHDHDQTTNKDQTGGGCCG
jgi:hypothetical protein